MPACSRRLAFAWYGRSPPSIQRSPWSTRRRMTRVPDGATAGAAPAGSIRRRRVIYVEGYDPQGAKGYYRLFDRSWARFLKVWPLKSRLGELAVEPQAFAHWDVEAAGPRCKVVTRYNFL